MKGTFIGAPFLLKYLLENEACKRFISKTFYMRSFAI